MPEWRAWGWRVCLRSCHRLTGLGFRHESSGGLRLSLCVTPAQPVRGRVKRGGNEELRAWSDRYAGRGAEFEDWWSWGLLFLVRTQSVTRPALVKNALSDVSFFPLKTVTGRKRWIDRGRSGPRGEAAPTCAFEWRDRQGNFSFRVGSLRRISSIWPFTGSTTFVSAWIHLRRGGPPASAPITSRPARPNRGPARQHLAQPQPARHPRTDTTGLMSIPGTPQSCVPGYAMAGPFPGRVKPSPSLSDDPLSPASEGKGNSRQAAKEAAANKVWPELGREGYAS